MRAEDLLKSVVEHYDITALACRHYFVKFEAPGQKNGNSSLTTLRCARLKSRATPREKLPAGGPEEAPLLRRNVIDLVTYCYTCL